MVAPTGVILVVVIGIVAVAPVVILIAIVVVVIVIIVVAAVVGQLTGDEVVDINLDRDHHRDGIDGVNGAYDGRGRH